MLEESPNICAWLEKKKRKNTSTCWHFANTQLIMIHDREMQHSSLPREAKRGNFLGKCVWGWWGGLVVHDLNLHRGKIIFYKC